VSDAILLTTGGTGRAPCPNRKGIPEKLARQKITRKERKKAKILFTNRDTQVEKKFEGGKGARGHTRRQERWQVARR